MDTIDRLFVPAARTPRFVCASAVSALCATPCGNASAASGGACDAIAASVRRDDARTDGTASF